MRRNPLRTPFIDEVRHPDVLVEAAGVDVAAIHLQPLADAAKKNVHRIPVRRQRHHVPQGLGDERLGKKIAAEIHEVTSTIPARFGLAEELRAFRRVMKETYIAMVDHGDRYWADVTGDRD